VFQGSCVTAGSDSSHNIYTEPEPLIALETEAKVDPLLAGALGGYVPLGSPFDNPSTFDTPTPTLPQAPDCTVRPQTVVEIQRMRESAGRIARMIAQEVVVMNKRKSYVEQMTTYLNDRIRELNKVKSELAEELRWISVSQNRISELAEKEKLIKLQDVLACLQADKDQITGKSAQQLTTLTTLKNTAAKLIKNIKALRTQMSKTSAGEAGEASVTIF